MKTRISIDVGSLFASAHNLELGAGLPDFFGATGKNIYGNKIYQQHPL
jgi:hypothetical protein